ncbi:unnamed protein product [Ectocarpus sp. CCAP 1310/34]|nr:unnamed protein product [Ectocarpus sp. CCAP 1310/34]
MVRFSLQERNNRTSSGQDARARTPSVGAPRRLPGSRSQGRGITMSMPGWLVARGFGGTSTNSQFGGLQRHAVSATSGSVGSGSGWRGGKAGANGPSGFRGLVMAPAERSLPPSIQSAGRGLHRTVPAWQLAGRAKNGGCATERLLPQGSQSAGRGLHRTVPAWQLAGRAKNGGCATERLLPQGSQSAGRGLHRTVPAWQLAGRAKNGGCATERLLPQGSQSAGRGLHRTVPAWQLATREDDGCRALCRVGGLQQESALETADRAGNVGRGTAGEDTGASTRQLASGPHMSSASPPRMTGSIRRRAGSSGYPPEEEEVSVARWGCSGPTSAAASSVLFSEHAYFAAAASTRNCFGSPKRFSSAGGW